MEATLTDRLAAEKRRFRLHNSKQAQTLGTGVAIMPMFGRESEMSGVVLGWMATRGLVAKPEFLTPWGKCDVVGVRLFATRVADRLRLRQTKPVTSIGRAALLLNIPDIDSQQAISINQLLQQGGSAITEESLLADVVKLVEDRFVIYTADGALQKCNGWMPLQRRLVAVELKLARIEEAMRQAFDNLGFADESYVGLPAAVAERVAARPGRWLSCLHAGVGILSVSKLRCKVLRYARKNHGHTDRAVQMYCVEKFWRDHQRQLSINGSATASGRRAGPSSGKLGKDFPSA